MELPLITAKANRVFWMSGDAGRIETMVSAIPEAEYQWYLNNELIPAQTGNVLEIDTVSPSDAGTYKLKATNAAGQTESEEIIVSVGVFVDVSIVGGGQVSIEPDDPYYFPGEAVQLTAQPNENWVFSRWVGEVYSYNIYYLLGWGGDAGTH